MTVLRSKKFELDELEDAFRIKLKDTEKYHPESFSWIELRNGLQAVAACEKKYWNEKEQTCKTGLEIISYRFDKSRYTVCEVVEYAYQAGMGVTCDDLEKLHKSLYRDDPDQAECIRSLAERIRCEWAIRR